MRRPLFIVCLCLVAAAAIWLSSHDSDDVGKVECMHSLLSDERLTVTGRVYEKNTQTFKIEIIYQSETSLAAASRQTFPVNENLICETKEADKIRLGSVVTVSGIFDGFGQATNPGEFDAAAYYHRQGVCGTLTDINILSVSSQYSIVRENLYRLRCCFRERLYLVFPAKEASVLTAMLLGDKEGLDRETKELYMENGIVHILSISGLHITMIGMGLYKLLRRMGVPVGIAVSIGGIVLLLYGLMTGMSVSACRAIGMYLIRMLAVVVGRTYDMLTSLGVLAVFLVGQNPSNLMNAGFLLSFGSIMGIGLLYPSLMPGEEKRVSKPLQSLLAGGSITLFTLPIQLWFYYEVPTYSILINMLVLPFMSIVMITGLAAMLLPGFGVVGTVTCLILQGYEWVCERFAALPFPAWNPGKPAVWQVVGYYVILLGLIWIMSRKAVVINKYNSRYFIPPILMTVAVMILALRIPGGNIVTFLDVGQGDGIVIETASGEVFLFDCGSSSRKSLGEYVLVPFLKYRGISHIDAVFASHGDTDHCSGIVELLTLGEEEGITIGQLVLPAIAEGERQEEFAQLIQSAENKIPIAYVKAGDCFATKKVGFLCLHPPAGYDAEDSNAYSQCFYVEFKTKKDSYASLLLTGDVEGNGEKLLLQELKNRDIDNITILKVAHHGSRNSGSEEFLKQIRPQLAVISCGKDNSYGHPHEETLERLQEVESTVLTTPKCGAIMVEIGKAVKVYRFSE